MTRRRDPRPRRVWAPPGTFARARAALRPDLPPRKALFPAPQRAERDEPDERDLFTQAVPQVEASDA